MEDVQPGSEQTPEAPEAPEAPERDPERDIAAERAADPKPTYEGDWQSATGVQKGQHSERVRQWRRREEERAAYEAQRLMGSGAEQPVPRMTPPDAPSATPSVSSAVDQTRAVLEAIRDNPQAHDSDRIRAAQQLIALDRGGEAEATGDGGGLRQLRAVLELLNPDERLAWLQAERLSAKG